jgi:hypothetical protein
MNLEISETLQKLHTADALHWRNLLVIPLIADNLPPVDYVALDEALIRGTASITEVSEQGTVPTLRFRNQGSEPVLLLDGEELTGAKQNRILNITILAAAHSEMEIPVSCVEQGRWSWRSKTFSASNRAIFSKLRRQNVEDVTRNMSDGLGARADQGSVWRHVADKSLRMKIHSDSSAASAVYEEHEAQIREFAEQLRPLPNQIGATFLVNGRFAGTEVLASPDLFAKLLPKIARSYAIDALEDAEVVDYDHVATWEPKSLVDELQRSTELQQKAAGLGDNVRLTTPKLHGAALVVDHRLVHLAVFAASYS